jgi:catechol 2,3-dioxygenase-like lactoylglutathione lyase family enzyme
VLTSFDHAVIAVRDLETAAADYERLLGRRRSWLGVHPDLGTKNALFKLDNSYLELLAPQASGPVAELLMQRLEQQGEGLVGMAFGTDDAERCAETLRERGVAAADPRPGEGRDLETGATRRWRSVMLPSAETRGLTLFAIEHVSPPEALPGAVIEAEAGAVEGLDHIVVNTVDAEAAVSFYAHKLGIRLAVDRRFEARGVRLLFFRIGGITVEFAASLDESRPGETPDRFFGLAYRVADAHAARARIAAAGFEIGRVRDGHKPGTLVCTVRDPTHGVPTLLISS